METIYILIDRWVDKEDGVHTYIPYNGILISHKKNEIMPYAGTWVQLEIIVLSKSERERQILHDITLLWNLKYGSYELIYKTETD